MAHPPTGELTGALQLDDNTFVTRVGTGADIGADQSRQSPGKPSDFTSVSVRTGQAAVVGAAVVGGAVVDGANVVGVGNVVVVGARSSRVERSTSLWSPPSSRRCRIRTGRALQRTPKGARGADHVTAYDRCSAM